MTYVESFIVSLGLQCDELARLLLKTVEDCELFYINFLGINKHIIDDLLDYREEKLNKSEITVDKFLEMCYNLGIRQSFEQTFLQPLSNEELFFIANVINSNDDAIKLEDIYNEFQKNVNKNILKLML